MQLDFRFRNGASVKFEAQRIDVQTLLGDVKAYINTKPGRNLDWNMMNIQDIGVRLVQRGETKYLAEKVGSWSFALKPREKHFDRRTAIETPLIKPGAYMVSSQMENGNASRIVVWVDDTVIVQKQFIIA